MNRKILPIILMFCMLFLVMSGCVNTDTSDQSSSGKSPSSESASNESTKATDNKENTEFIPTYPIVDEPIKVTGLITAKDTAERLTWTTVEDVTGIDIEWINVESDSLAVYLAAGDWPDFFHTKLNATYINDYGITGGMFVDYTDYLNYMPNLVRAFEDYPDSRKVVTEINGAIYQIPRMEVSATTTTARLYYREDSLKKLDLEVPTTTEEFYDALIALKQANDGAAPLVTGIKEFSYFGAFMYAPFGTSRSADFEDDETGKVIWNRTSDQYKYYLKYLNRLYSEGLLHREYLTLDNVTKLSLVQSGLGVFTDGTAHSLVAEDFESGQFEIGVLAPLTSEYDNTRVVIGNSASQTGGFFINVKSEYITQLVKMFDIMFATEEVVPGTGLYGQAFCYGPENVCWAFTGDKKDEYEFILPENYDGTFTTYQYDNVIFDNAGRQDALANAVTSTISNNRARQIGFINNLIPYQEEIVFPSQYLKFTEDEQTVIDDLYTGITTYVGEMHGKFIAGIADIDNEWDNYCETIKKMGIDDVIKAYQASYDRWNGK